MSEGGLGDGMVWKARHGQRLWKETPKSSGSAGSGGKASSSISGSSGKKAGGNGINPGPSGDDKSDISKHNKD